MALEPSGLPGDGAAADGPVGAVSCGGDASAWRLSDGWGGRYNNEKMGIATDRLLDRSSGSRSIL